MPSLSNPPLGPKTIILALDGTANEFCPHNTNVIRLYSLFEKRTPEQVLYYQSGIGTYSAEGCSPIVRGIMQSLDSAFAWSLDTHVGLLLRGNEQTVASAYERYLDVSPDGQRLAEHFKQTFGTYCPIEFLGVWDTVASVGVVPWRHLPFTANNCIIKTFRHALALDERRTRFRHNPWHRSPRDQENSGRNSLLQGIVSAAHRGYGTLSSFFQPMPDYNVLAPRPEDLHAVHDSCRSRSHPPTDVKEVWFAGCHSDTGGGHGDPDASNTISDASLGWMINQILISNVPIHFSASALENLKGFNIVLANPEQHDTSRFNSILSRVEQKKPKRNVNSPIHDELRSNWLWWILEFIPFRSSALEPGGKSWKVSWALNLGRGRKIWDNYVLIHESVKLRMQKASYQPMATFEQDNPHVEYVDDFGGHMGEGRVHEGRLVLTRPRGASLNSIRRPRPHPDRGSRRSFWEKIGDGLESIRRSISTFFSKAKSWFGCLGF